MRVDARGWSFTVGLGGPDDGVPAVLLHGFPQHSGEWELVAPVLHAGGVRTVALDQRGYSPGARPTDVEAYRIGECVADVQAVLEALQLPSAHIVGHDWGALVAWHLAARHPQLVTTLTALSVPHPLALAVALSDDEEQRQRMSYVDLFRDSKAERVLLADRAQRLREMLTGVPPDRVDGYLAAMQEPGALTAALNWYRAMSPADLDGLGRVEAPTTFVWSDGDAAIGRRAAESCAGHVTGDYRFIELPGVTHWMPEEAPEAVATAVRERIGQ